MRIEKNRISTPENELRRNAEQQVLQGMAALQTPRNEAESQKLVHELEVHQIELEMQNAELRQARHELDTALEKYTCLYDFAPVAYFSFDRFGAVNSVNLSGAGLLGVERSRLIGRRFEQFVIPKNRPAFTAFIGKVLTSMGKETCEIALKNVDDLPLIVQIDGIAVSSGTEVFVAARDVTDRNRMEVEIKQHNEQLEIMVKERTGELERINKELEGFCYALSHEFRAPIARLEGFGTTLIEIAQEGVSGPIMHCAQRIVAASNQLRTVIDALINMNIISRAWINVQRLNLSEMASQIVTELLEDVGQPAVTVAILPGVMADGDRDMLDICLRNLFSNAIKYSSGNPDALIEFGQKIIDGENVYFVRDNGVGFDMAHAKYIFQPFCRLHHATEFEGAGVGLATVLRIIEKHNGRIWIESTLGKGATFNFTLL